MKKTPTLDQRATEVTRKRYQRLSAVYDFMEFMAEKRYQAWRKRLWSMAEGESVLEIGVGTGKNMPYYPAGTRITAIDLTPGMLARASKKLHKTGTRPHVDLRIGDTQALEFPDATFDVVLATFVFCSVPDPVLGLREVRRVVKPGGKVLLLEHMRSSNPFLGKLMDWLNPIVVRLMGANINRITLDNVRKAGLKTSHIEELDSIGVFKLVRAEKEG